MLRCIARWGIGKTTVDDLAREAGCGRASVYRAFPGGKEAVLRDTVSHEVRSMFAALDEQLTGAADLEDALVAGITLVARAVQGHAALQFVLSHEPGLILPHLAFARMNVVLAAASDRVGPRLARWIGDEEEAARGAEWVARVVVSHLASPSPDLDIADEDAVRGLVRRFLLPALPDQGAAGAAAARPVADEPTS